MPSVPRRALHPRCHPERVRQHADDDVGVNVQEDKASVDDAVFHLVGQCRQVMQEHRGNRVTRSARKGSVHDWIVNGPRLLRPHIEHRAGMSANAGVCDEIPEQVCDGRRENVTLLRVRARAGASNGRRQTPAQEVRPEIAIGIEPWQGIRQSTVKCKIAGCPVQRDLSGPAGTAIHADYVATNDQRPDRFLTCRGLTPASVPCDLEITLLIALHPRANDRPAERAKVFNLAVDNVPNPC